MDLYYTFAGFFVGLLVGLTGIGGGALMTPILIVVFKVPLVTAVSTDLLYAAITKSAGAISYCRQQQVHYKIVVLLLAGSLPGSWLTLNYLSSLQGLEKIESVVNTVLGSALILTSIAVFMRSRICTFADRYADSAGSAKIAKFRPLVTVVCGALLGVLVTLSSVGAGALGTAILIICYPKMRMSEIVGTDLVHAVILTAVAGAGHYTLGSVDLSLLGYLILGSLPGVFIGSHFGAKLSSNVMQPIIASLLLVIGGHFITS
jgi:uncharacterized membrane protein YfcA